MFLIACSFKDASGSLWTLIATSVGLQIAALVQYGDCSLTLFQAVQVNNLVWMANFCIVIGLASYSRGRRILEHDFLVQIGAMIEMYLSIVLTFLLWTAAPQFNSDPCAPQTPFVFFWRSFAAVRTGRHINLAFVSLVTIGYTYVTYTELRARWEARNKCDAVRAQSPPLQHITAESEPSETEEEHSFSNMARRKRKGRKRSPQWSNLPPILFSIVFFETAVTAYFVAMNEILVSKSAPSDEKQSPWSFGQVRATCYISREPISDVTRYLR